VALAPGTPLTYIDLPNHPVGVHHPYAPTMVGAVLAALPLSLLFAPLRGNDLLWALTDVDPSLSQATRVSRDFRSMADVGIRYLVLHKDRMSVGAPERAEAYCRCVRYTRIRGSPRSGATWRLGAMSRLRTRLLRLSGWSGRMRARQTWFDRERSSGWSFTRGRPIARRMTSCCKWHWLAKRVV
jgi:hypothetical protein